MVSVDGRINCQSADGIRLVGNGTHHSELEEWLRWSELAVEVDPTGILTVDHAIDVNFYGGRSADFLTSNVDAPVDIHFLLFRSETYDIFHKNE